jgi:hypothetical protein
MASPVVSVAPRRSQENHVAHVTDPTAATTDDIMRELLALRVLVERLVSKRPEPLTRADHDRLAKILPAVGGVFGSEWFLVRELFASPAAAVRLVLRGLNARQVGRLLRRGEGVVVDGYLVQRGGIELHARLARIVQVQEFPDVRNLLVSPQVPRGRVE